MGDIGNTAELQPIKGWMADFSSSAEDGGMLREDSYTNQCYAFGRRFASTDSGSSLAM